MRKFRISIPYALPLTKEQNWIDKTGEKINFGIVRCHFLVEERQAENKTSIGEILSALQAPKGTKIQSIKSIELEQERIDYTESLQSSLISNEMILELSKGILAEFGNEDLIKLKNEFKYKWSNKLKTEFSQSFTFSTSIRSKSTEKYHLQYDIDADVVNDDSDTRLVIASVYKRIAWDVYLTNVDYLYVNYWKKLFGLRKTRKHKPHYLNGKPQNILKLNIPICTIKLWKPLENSGLLMRESKYMQEVEDFDEAIICAAERSKGYCEEIPHDQPTLYQIAVAAFPLKWIHRKGNWTIKELQEIEFEDAKESAWWYTHGPGKNSW